MSDIQLSESPDEVAALIAGYAASVPGDLDERSGRAAKAVLIDSLAVAMGALRASCGAGGAPSCRPVRRRLCGVGYD